MAGPCRHEEDHRVRVKSTGDEAQDLDCRGIEPLDVVGEENDGAVLGQHAEDAEDSQPDQED